MESNSINLFQNQVVYSPKLALIERFLRTARYIFLSFVFGVGIITLIVYFVFQLQHQSLDTKREELYTIVKNDVTKEALLLSLRSRVSALKKIMTYQISIAPYIDTTLLIAVPPRLTSFSLGEANSIHIGVEAATVEEAITVMETVIQLTNDNKIKNPTVTSILLNKDATVTLGFTYTVVLQ
ncbi:MAG: hypothetical protein WAV51_01590 [Microgenomates group bacterium]